MRRVIQTEPVQQVVTTAEAKTHLRVTTSDEDAYITALVEAARIHVERAVLNRPLITQTWDVHFDRFPAGDEIRLPLPPLQSVTGVYYTPDGGSEQTFASSNYTVETYGEPGRIVLNTSASWPGDELEEVNGVRVRFVAGYGDDAADVPGPIRHAIKLIVAEMYENREDVVIGAGNSVVTVPYASKALLQNYRFWSWPE